MVYKLHTHIFQSMCKAGSENHSGNPLYLLYYYISGFMTFYVDSFVMDG